jgi:branched-chain amino acid transport system substrate-binding protein
VDVPGHKDPASYLESKSQSLKDKGLHYVQGWYTMHVMAEGIRSLVKDGKEVTGENLKTALEGIDAVGTGEVTPPIDFTGESHEGMDGTSIYQVKGATMAELAKAVRP